MSLPPLDVHVEAVTCTHRSRLGRWLAPRRLHSRELELGRMIGHECDAHSELSHSGSRRWIAESS